MDSGADEYVFPAMEADRILPRTSDLVAANGSTMKTYGKRRMAVVFGDGEQTIFHEFWIANVKRTILGADFFFNHGLVIDMGRSCLVSRSGAIIRAWRTTKLPSVCGHSRDSSASCNASDRREGQGGRGQPVRPVATGVASTSPVDILGGP